MAIKERKQITGTTAQIQDYAGHEGQIVWDKEKKTFVGMSGTAGENYPLAPKGYVDNEVAKCLPKTGGLLSGSINLDPNVGGGNIDIGFNYDENLGSGVGFRSINHTKDPGAFFIYAQDLTQGAALIGKPDGTLTWGGKEIERVSQMSKEDIEVPNSSQQSYQSYIRFDSGLQIIFGSTNVNGIITEQKRVNYVVPFSGIARVASASDANIGATYNVCIGWKQATGFSIGTDNDNAHGWCDWIAVGFWK